MILRALFWIAVVGVLMPHEPDLGLGRPTADVTTSLPAPVAEWVGRVTDAPHQACASHAEGCAAVLNVVDAFQTAAVRNLARVKADIEASRRGDARRLAYND
jgi:hypothetical protein